MEINVVHLSDIHFYPGGEERKPAYRPFLADLRSQIPQSDVPNTFVFISGDLAQAGGSADHYTAISKNLGAALDEMGIPAERRVCVPGNHDVDTAAVNAKLLEHEAIVSSQLGESDYCKFLTDPSEVFRAKFSNYLKFQASFAKFGISSTTLGGMGHTLCEDVSVFCANSAFLSSGAAQRDGKKLPDRGRLALATRQIEAWLEKDESRVRILVMHHPISWHNEWSEAEFRRIERHFDLVLTGHEHDQDVCEHVSYGSTVVRMCAPALLTSKREPMGYAVARVCAARGPLLVRYRQWSKHSNFVLGTLLANNDAGEIVFAQRTGAIPSQVSFAESFFEAGLNSALQAFAKHPRIWVDPTIQRSAETDRRQVPGARLGLFDILKGTKSAIIKAPPQYGLTCLSWALCREASRGDAAIAWVRIDLETVKPHNVRDEVAAQLKMFGKSADALGAIVVDSWKDAAKNARKSIEALSSAYPNARIIVMQTADRPTLEVVHHSIAGREFDQYYLWALPRSGIREVVRGFGQNLSEEERESLASKVAIDIDSLNLPRTALNCLTLLLVSDIEYEESPVNRAEVIKKVLFLIFSLTSVPNYQSKPDLKDCEHLLGYLAEKLIRSQDFNFDRESFLALGKEFCDRLMVEIESKSLLTTLLQNGVLVEYGGKLRFRFSYWIYYFAAARMHHDREFAAYILSDMQYTRFPEVVEFYTGLDRRRTDALEALNDDLSTLSGKVESMCEMGTPVELFSAARWEPTESEVIRLRADIANRVLESKLPDAVKDQFADAHYDNAKPYEQQIQAVMSAFSFDKLSAGLRSGARALRNSDFVDPAVKVKLLSSILRCWAQIQTVLVLLAPTLASQGSAAFDGTKFYLASELPQSLGPAQRVSWIWSVVPHNVLSWFRNDLSSGKLGPLLFDAFRKASDPLTKHNLATLIVAFRPNGWRLVVEDYIASVDKNAFYLADILGHLVGEYQFGVMKDRYRRELGELIKMAVAKHETGVRRPGPKLIGKVPDEVLPTPSES